ncbi:ABC transporter permease (plasmid) [Deinococcus metallilatus]|uniref:ABC-type nitrate/sulfonate/bicarbonate transport system permease component n=1 Tax=Deinococcus metallilatus TaxID=1211322 RepID=A0ABR6MUW2_9DEIO|nr:ABC transporter permease [Deinococcus metallilatus]MBB5295733.1 ABC-type nitrate/sulfonate/bicarbonate transport system permease component [Deinococcus metallilatus]QBY06821.1 ABC transporter permease [Deinococcus metallilatus]GMA14263.1 nitrate ABC transporter permease [Deinococcus metallilatus]
MRRWGSALVLGLAVLTALEGLSHLGLVPSSLLPAPSAVAAALWNNAPELTAHSAQTLAETLLGFGAAVVLGLLAALALHRFAPARRAVLPWLVVSQTIPLIALAPLLLVWLGFGLLPKVVIVTLACFFPVTVATLDGLTRADPDLVRVLRAMNASEGQVDWLVRFPGALPAFFSGLKLAATYAVTSAIFGEYVGGYVGLGIFIQTSANARATDLVFAAIFLSALYSVLFVALIGLVQRRVLRWLPREDSP